MSGFFRKILTAIGFKEKVKAPRAVHPNDSKNNRFPADITRENSPDHFTKVHQMVYYMVEHVRKRKDLSVRRLTYCVVIADGLYYREHKKTISGLGYGGSVTCESLDPIRNCITDNRFLQIYDKKQKQIPTYYTHIYHWTAPDYVLSRLPKGRLDYSDLTEEEKEMLNEVLRTTKVEHLSKGYAESYGPPGYYEEEKMYISPSDWEREHGVKIRDDYRA